MVLVTRLLIKELHFLPQPQLAKMASNRSNEFGKTLPGTGIEQLQTFKSSGADPDPLIRHTDPPIIKQKK
jgi:hypothetical protein